MKYGQSLMVICAKKLMKFENRVFKMKFKIFSIISSIQILVKSMVMQLPKLPTKSMVMTRIGHGWGNSSCHCYITFDLARFGRMKQLQIHYLILLVYI